MFARRFAASAIAVATLAAGVSVPAAYADEGSSASAGTAVPLVTRVYGNTRYDTMAALVGRGGWSKGGTVVVASGANWPDALAATGYAGTLDAPIVLTEPGVLSSQAAAQLKALAPKHIVVAGGSAAVSARVVNQLKGYASRVDRVYGDTRVDTANAMYVDGDGWGKTIVLATAGGYVDALSMGSYAYRAKAPVMLVDGGLKIGQEAILKSGRFDTVLIAGGVNAVSQAVSDRAKTLTGVEPTRLGGDTRYETSARIADWTLSNGLKMQDAVFASGSNFPDALAAGPLAGRTGSPVLLVDQSNGSAQEVVRDHKSGVSQVWVAGGPAAVPDSVVDSVRGMFADAKQVITSGDSVFVVKSDGSLWAWGANSFGQLGVGDKTDRSKPVRILGGISAVQPLEYTSPYDDNTVHRSVFAVKSDGSLWAWGNNSNGQLGVGDKKERLKPVRVQGPGNVSTIISGSKSTFALTKDGSLWAWGNNKTGVLGVGDTREHLKPSRVQGLDGVSSISTEGFSSYAVKRDGSLWAWGDNWDGQLGLSDKNGRLTPTRVNGVDNVSSVTSKYGSVFAVRKDGSLYAWGYNYLGQLGVGDKNDHLAPTRVTGLDDVSTVDVFDTGENGSRSVFAVNHDGSLYAWGSGWLGVGDEDEHSAPVRVQDVGAVASVNSYGGATYVIGNDGSLYAWGANDFGELGVGDEDEHSTPARVQGVGAVSAVDSSDGYSAFAVAKDGSLWVWGGNEDGQLGVGDTEDRLTPTQVQGLGNVSLCRNGYVLTGDGALWKLAVNPVRMM